MTLITASCSSKPPVAGTPATPTTAAESPATGTVATTTNTETSSRAPNVPGTDQEPTQQADDGDPLPALGDLSAPSFAPDTRTDELSVEIGETAHPTLQQAIDVFDISMAPMPGATASTLPAGTGFSPTYALNLIRGFRRLLSPEQLAVVDSFTGTVVATYANTSTEFGNKAPVTTAAAPTPPSEPAAVTPGHWAPPSTVPSALSQRLSDLFTAARRDWFNYRGDLIGLVDSFSMTISTTQPKDLDPRAQMSTIPAENDPGACGITVYPRLYNANPDDALVKLVFAHELFHCIQFAWLHTDNPDALGPYWLTEGSAEFAALDLYRRTWPQTSDFTAWLTATARPLTAASYDAWALFEAFRDQFPTDPYVAIAAMVKAGPANTDAVLHAGHFDDDVFASLWTSTSLRSTRFTEPSWQLDWPGQDPAHGARDTAVTLASRGIGRYNVNGKGNFVHQQYLVPFDTKVGIVGVTPAGGPMMTSTDNGTVTIGEGDQKWFCVDSDHCTCPQGTHPVVDLHAATAPMLFSYATKATASSAGVRAMAWDPKRFCTTDPTPPTGTDGWALGDPHMRTVNGLTYDFMRLGEFVTISDPSGGMTIQERQQPLLFGAGISAVAVGTGDHRVTLTAPAFGDEPITVRLDGTVTTTTSFRVGDVGVHSDQEVWKFNWADGSSLEVTWKGAFFLHVSMSTERAARAVGLLGRTNQSFLDDHRLADGRRAAPGDGPNGFDDAWSVTDQTTLFDYAPGESTATFRTAHLPPEQPPSNDAVTRCQQRLGTQATTFEIESCAYDLTASGNSAMIDAYQQVSETRRADSPADPSRTSTVSSTPGATTPTAPNAGKATLTLAGPIGLGANQNAANSLNGNVELSAGSVVVVKAVCPADPNFDLQIALTTRTDGLSGRVGLCGPQWKLGVFDAQPTDETHEGEGYLLAREAGTYDVTVTTGSANPAYVSVQVFSDPTPTVITADGLPANGYHTTLTGVADTVLVFVAPGDKGGDWTLTGGDQACASVYYLAGPNAKTPDTLGGVCRHHTNAALGPYTEQLPIIIFNRTDTHTDIAILKQNP